MKLEHLSIISVLLVGLAGSPALALAVSEDNPYRNIILNKEEEFDYDDSHDKPWKEQDIELPELYDTDGLEEAVVTEVQKGFTVLIDKKHLSIGEDGVLRYWLVLRSELGAENAMYEGMRCETSEYKTYAFAIGQEQKKIEPMRKSPWHKVRRVRGPNFRWELMHDYFCSVGRPKPIEQIVRNLEAGTATIRPDKNSDSYL
jgi:hypothetical protein